MWFWSYLHARSQCVYVDGKVSGFEVVDVGVPQGSVLGALLYILFVNDLPEVVHGHHGTCHGNPNQAQVFFNISVFYMSVILCYVSLLFILPCICIGYKEPDTQEEESGQAGLGYSSKAGTVRLKTACK